MGNFLSSNNSFSKSEHDNCECDLYDKYGHCCRHSCFGGDRKQTEKALLSALKKYNADYLTSTIISYLPDVYDLVEISRYISTKGYLSYSYEPLKSRGNDGKYLCDTWLLMVIPSYAARQIQVCNTQ